MILTCSSCATRFLVDAGAIGPVGRHVRCARCQHGWFQEPADDLPRSVPPAQEAAGISDMDAASDDAVALPGRKPSPLRRGANLPALPSGARRMRDALSWAALGLFVIGLLAGGYILREQIITAWPQSSKLYTAMGAGAPASRLRFADVSFSQGTQQGRPALTVKGLIFNDGPGEMTVPPVLIKLRNAGGRDIFQWTYELPEPLLAAGAKMAFETSLADPPAEARNLEVTFGNAK